MVAVQTDKIKAGQILAEEVRDINGRLLLASGNEIQANHIRIFKIWGISEVNVAGGCVAKNEIDPRFDPELVEQAKECMKHVFCHADLEHPVMKELFRIAAQYRCQHNLVGRECHKDFTKMEIHPDSGKINFKDKLNKKKIILPEIPAVVLELNEVIANPRSSAESIAQVVNKSPSLTAVLLKIVNSSFYGFPSKIDRVSHAVTLIGTREISELILGISILSIFKNIPRDIIDMYAFLKHSLACGILARVLAAHLNSPNTEQLFISGLLHDLGRLILYIYFPKESHIIITRSRSQSQLLYNEEKEFLGCDHAQVGRQLMKQWNLPVLLENNVCYHHQPSHAQQPIPATIVHLADAIVNSLAIGSSGEKFVPPLDYAALNNLDLSPSSMKKLIDQAIHQFKALEPILHV